MLESKRLIRLSEQIKHEVYSIIKNLKDPRIPELFTVTHAKVSPDLHYAQIGVSCFGEEEQKKSFVKALKGASGFIRRELAGKMDLKHVPELTFSFDDSAEYSIRIQKQLDALHIKDSQDE